MMPAITYLAGSVNCWFIPYFTHISQPLPFPSVLCMTPVLSYLNTGPVDSWSGRYQDQRHSPDEQHHLRSDRETRRRTQKEREKEEGETWKG